MSIKGLASLSAVEIHNEIKRGAKFIVYQYTISLLFITLKKNTDIYFVRSYENRAARGLIWTFISFVCGWWCFPEGPSHTLTAITNNLNGGIDVTENILSAVNIQ
ncbi:hypothetical protein GS399_08095 [Pedobacter sp. HMF7647]|uniref:Uncharacterized protein n=1 Tax=Hufsiella arboris TaxID=2695275 RepID=A0A7K1Y8K8_9SPHI|nr:hypothetical protein [Hufsiella arboris]MXV50933.1 hypothetical protein [Hufsiella arboris]